MTYRSPGEHIDYALFGVLPAAIEPDFLIACAPRDSEPGLINLQNLNPKYTPQQFTAKRDVTTGKWSLDIDKTQLRWESYVKAGYYVRTMACARNSVDIRS